MAENRRGKDSRYYLSRGQMIVLGGTFTLASVVIFLIGMMVGKVIEERKILKRDEPLVKIPVKPAGPASGPAAKNDEITFYDTLAKSRSGQALAEQPSKEAKSAEKNSGAEENETKVQVPVKPRTQSAKLTEDKEVKPPPVAESAKNDSSDGSDGKIWRAQVDAFPDERSAKLLVDRLKNKGYNAYVSEVQFRGKPWYRVSVGKYGAREEADKVVNALKGRENYAKAFAASK